FRPPAAAGLGGGQRKLEELRPKRTIASQRADAKGNTVSARIGAQASTGEDVEFSASGRTITFYGFLQAYIESSEDPDEDADDQQTKLPQLTEGTDVGLND